MEYKPQIGDRVVIGSASEYVGGIEETRPLEEYQKYVGSVGTVQNFMKDEDCQPHLLHLADIRVEMLDGEVIYILRKDVELVRRNEEPIYNQSKTFDSPTSKPSELQKMEQIVTFEIEDANFLLSDFRIKYNKNEDRYVFFYKQKNSRFPIFEIKNNQKLEGYLKITLFNNNVIQIKQQ